MSLRFFRVGEVASVWGLVGFAFLGVCGRWAGREAKGVVCEGRFRVIRVWSLIWEGVGLRVPISIT